MMRYILTIIAFVLLSANADCQTLVDDFNRSNRTLSSDGWGQVEGGCSIINGVMGGTSAGAENLCYTPSAYNANMAAFITVSTKPETVDSGLSFFVRFNASTFSGYDIQMTTQSGLDRFRLYRFDNGTFGSQLGSTYYAEVSDGDQFGIVAQGASLKCYYKPLNGSWMLIIDVTDSTYQAGGRIAFGAYGNVGRYDDLYGGNDLSLPNAGLTSVSVLNSGANRVISNNGAIITVGN